MKIVQQYARRSPENEQCGEKSRYEIAQTTHSSSPILFIIAYPARFVNNHTEKFYIHKVLFAVQISGKYLI